MSEQDLEPLSSLATALISAERRRGDDPAGAQAGERIFERLATTVALGADAASLPHSTGSVASGAAKASALGTKTTAIAALAFIAGGGAGAAIHAGLTPSHPVVASSVATLVVPAPVMPAATISAPVDIVTIPASALPDRRLEPPPAAKEPLGDRDVDLSRERAIIDQARMAAARHDPSGALTALDTHAHDFPRGRLVEEREALAVVALVDLGRTNEAEERAARFRRRFHGSVLLPAVEAAVARGKIDTAP